MGRYTQIATIAWDATEATSLEAAITQATALFELASVSRPDLIIYPEYFLHCYDYDHLYRTNHSIPSAVTDHFSRLADDNNTNVVIGIPVTVDGRTYNSAIVIDRSGQIIGRYDKMYPTIDEIQRGITPGSKPVVHELDFGRIGHAICFDANFIELAVAYRDLDPDIICFHSMEASGSMLEAWAMTVGSYVVSAYAQESRIIDMTGIELARTGNRYEQHSLWQLPPILNRQINLDRKLFHDDDNIANACNEGKLQQLLRVRACDVTHDHNYPSSTFALGALDGVSLAELMAEYKLETRNDYLRRAKQIIEEAKLNKG